MIYSHEIRSANSGDSLHDSQLSFHPEEDEDVEGWHFQCDLQNDTFFHVRS